MRHAIAFVAFLWLMALVFVGIARAAGQPIYVQNTSTAYSAAELANDLPAYQAAVSLDFAPVWGIDAKLITVAPGADVPVGAWSIAISDYSDAFGAPLGYHYFADGVPYAKVFAQTTLNDDSRVSSTLMHELFEMLADPYADTWVKVQRRVFPFYLLETADPVEDDQFGYTRPGANGGDVLISDFVTRAWFRSGSLGPWDFAGHTTRPLQILTGGFQIAWDPKKGRMTKICYRNRPCRRQIARL